MNQGTALSQTQRPTEAELAILSILWLRGPSTVRQVWQEMGKSVGYTTVLKLLQIMSEKGLVDRDDRKQSHVYSARHGEEQTQRLLVRDLLDRAFGGSTQKLILRALDARKVPAEEMAQIQALLQNLKGGKR